MRWGVGDVASHLALVAWLSSYFPSPLAVLSLALSLGSPLPWLCFVLGVDTRFCWLLAVGCWPSFSCLLSLISLLCGLCCVCLLSPLGGLCALLCVSLVSLSGASRACCSCGRVWWLCRLYGLSRASTASLTCVSSPPALFLSPHFSFPRYSLVSQCACVCVYVCVCVCVCVCGRRTSSSSCDSDGCAQCACY